MNTTTTKNWQVTRYCCTSGYCVDCHTRGTRLGIEHRARILHADQLTEEQAKLMAHNWASYGALASPMPAVS